MSVGIVVGNPKPKSRTYEAARVVAQQLTGRDPDFSVDLSEFRRTSAAFRELGAPGLTDLSRSWPRARNCRSTGMSLLGRTGLPHLGEREFRRAAQVGDVVVELSKRGGQDLLRPIDPHFGQAIIDTYGYTPTYEPDVKWIVEGQFLPFDSVRPTAVGATLGDLVHVHSAVGTVTFTIDGVEQQLLVFVGDGHQAGEAAERAQALATLAERVSLRRLVTADEVAAVVTVLASPRSVAINGSTVDVGGGTRGSIFH